jgi:uncharacterized protein
MKQGRSLRKMLVPTIVMGVLAAAMLYIGYRKGGGEHIMGLRITWDLLLEIAPMMVFSFIIAGMIQVLIPPEIISKWVGVESGFRGILIGTAIGSLTPSGPFVSMPIAAGFLRAGASIGTVVAFLRHGLYWELPECLLNSASWAGISRWFVWQAASSSFRSLRDSWRTSSSDGEDEQPARKRGVLTRL